ncbi:MAG: hypothetical protein H6683_04530 [Deltaproteobacteria bacterium]|nr:hypothetical protein [Deltaproteobacteria bacterium]
MIFYNYELYIVQQYGSLDEATSVPAESPLLSTILHFVASYLLYPALLLSTFALLIYYIAILLKKSDNIVRSIVATILPIATMTILAVTKFDNAFTQTIDSLNPVTIAATGAVNGLMLYIFAHLVAKLSSSKEALFNIFIMYLSSIGSSILYSIATIEFEAINSFLLGFILALGLLIILQGLPEGPASTPGGST